MGYGMSATYNLLPMTNYLSQCYALFARCDLCDLIPDEDFITVSPFLPFSVSSRAPTMPALPAAE